MIVVTHYQRLLNYIVPDFVHVLAEGRIVKSGGKELALELEAEGLRRPGVTTRRRSDSMTAVCGTNRRCWRSHLGLPMTREAARASPNGSWMTRHFAIAPSGCAVSEHGSSEPPQRRVGDFTNVAAIARTAFVPVAAGASAGLPRICARS